MNEDDDRALYAAMLDRKRDDLVRSAVLQVHTAIEDVLNSQIICSVLKVKPEDRTGKMRSKPARALRKMLSGAGSIGFDMKLNFAIALGLLSQRKIASWS
jgi:phosphosulfolactate phosphohydrolase-like enzyme